MAEKRLSGLLYRRIVAASIHSWRGLVDSANHEEAFRCQLFLSLFLVPLAFVLAIDPVQLILLIGSVILVMIVELLNTGLEMVVDRIGIEFHELSGRAKDVGSAAVLFSMLIFLLTWITIALSNYGPL